MFDPNTSIGELNGGTGCRVDSSDFYHLCLGGWKEDEIGAWETGETEAG